MARHAIQADGLSKRYRLGRRLAGYRTLRETLAEAAWKPLRMLRSLGQRPADDAQYIWALKDFSFEVGRGEVVGIIGRNGAGKSTLLKLLSRITDPTEGRAVICGRVGSLLEVGTGFHPELTGRENIYLSGAILGMKRAEIARRFDEIVAFAEVERFVDTAVKHYSSGMYLRLAFAVAAHLEPDILLVDEVLAVGDTVFQKRCLGQMGRVAAGGRTVLFVSHNLAAINQLCPRSLVIDAGRLRLDGPSGECVDQYLRWGAAVPAVVDTSTRPECGGTGLVKIMQVAILDPHGQPANPLGIGEPFTIRLQARFQERVDRLAFGVEVASATGVPLLNLRSDGQGLEFGPYEAGSSVELAIQVPGLPFYPGLYYLQPWLGEHRGPRCDQIFEGVCIEIEAKGRHQAERLLEVGRGLVVMDCGWSSRLVASGQ